jgi:anti-sigma B factor antagonist
MADEPDGLRIEHTAADDSARFQLIGFLDLSTVDLLKTTVGPACGAGRDVVLDLSGLTFCDSTGVGALVWLYRRAAAGDSRLIAYAPRKTVREVLRISGVDRIIPVRAAGSVPSAQEPG